MKKATIPIDKEELDEFIKQVEIYIATHYNHISLNSVSLVDGSAGVLLFYAYLYQTYQQGEYFEKFSALLESSIDFLEQYPTDSSLAYGFTGLFWVIQHLINNGILQQETQQMLEPLLETVIQSCKSDYETGNFDLLVGLIGKGVYFMEGYYLTENKNALEQTVYYLSQLASSIPYVASKNTSIAYLKNQSEYTAKPHTAKGQAAKPEHFSVNLGMAHGVPSIISFLSKVHQKGIATSLCRNLVDSEIQALLANQSPRGISLFPINSNSTAESRLAWCHGDLGPALSLFHAGLAFNNQSWTDSGIEIALLASKRTINNSGIIMHPNMSVYDTGFCHGTSGVAHIFHRFYQSTGLDEFSKCALYWLDHTEMV
ncbi:lanthionine synthetase C family protein [Xanthocytophaga flava]|uniref:lanthionine synthetase C family protein n=1 Tax=Xanthocytophaga flava TaxID=3048013 RepID=UPI0028D269C5|nr:lanthionine synthetase C family protein [Xanthocytophaga flavus]MDJ1470235.1 lanthionine synthetase C family protein [Xanthocytophaga flavus]